MENFSNAWAQVVREDNKEKMYEMALGFSGEYFYQFRGVNSYTSKNIQNGNLVLSNPLDFNDPYDLYYCPMFEKGYVNSKNPKERSKYLIRKARDKKFAQAVNENNQDMYDKFIYQLEEFKKQAFISCFSENPNSVLMWGHYADKHRGYCAAYKKEDIVELCKRRGYRFGKVSYVELVLEVDFCTDKVKVIRESSFTKYKDWEYEKEWRIFAISKKIMQNVVDENINNHGMIIEPNIFPRRILLGSKMDSDTEKVMRKLCKEKSIEVAKMRILPERYFIEEK